MHEWPLLLFSVCIPASVGGFLFLALFHKKMAGKADPYQFLKAPLLVLLAVSLVGLLGAFFHLGTPTHAFNTMRGFGRSWMSNEIVLTTLFIILACLTCGLVLKQKKVNPMLLWATAVVGFIDVFCMSKLYTVTLVNGWNNVNTYLVFFGTLFTLGPVLCGSVMGATQDGDSVKKIIQWAFALAIFGLAIQAIGAVMFSISSADIQVINGTTAAEKLGDYTSMIAARWIFEIAGLAALGYVSMNSLKKVNVSVVYVVLAVTVICEAMSRYVFYVLGA